LNLIKDINMATSKHRNDLISSNVKAPKFVAPVRRGWATPNAMINKLSRKVTDDQAAISILILLA
jgi:hypothetical protein